MVDTNMLMHAICTCQVHTCSNFSDKQIESVSQSLSASANYLKKLVEGSSKPSKSNSTQKNNSTAAQPTEKSTVTVHADVSYGNALIGFTAYDSREIDTEAYTIKRRIYDSVAEKYPNLDDLVRDEKVKALRELKSVGFKYYTIKVTLFYVKDGLTLTIDSKDHHRLERPSKEYLESLLTDTFKGKIRTEPQKDSEPSVDTSGSGLPKA